MEEKRLITWSDCSHWRRKESKQIKIGTKEIKSNSVDSCHVQISSFHSVGWIHFQWPLLSLQLWYFLSPSLWYFLSLSLWYFLFSSLWYILPRQLFVTKSLFILALVLLWLSWRCPSLLPTVTSADSHFCRQSLLPTVTSSDRLFGHFRFVKLA